MRFGRSAQRSGGWTSVVFTDERVAVLRLERPAGGQPRLLSWDVFPREGADLEVLKRLRTGRRLGSGPCTTLLRHGQYQLLQVALPEVPEEEMRNALRWRIKDMVDFPVDQAGVDFLPVPRTGGGREAQAYVVAAPHGVLTPLVRLFQEAGVELAAIDIPEMVQRNVAALFEEENRGLALLVFDSDGGRLTFTARGELFVSRYIDVAPADLAQGNDEPGGLYERVLLDVQRTLDNVDRNYSALPINRLLVAPVAGAAGFTDYLRSNLYQPVETLDLGQRVDLSAVPGLGDPRQQTQVLLALGAALRDETANP
jgi:MSHA biogenesis protein MshI